MARREKFERSDVPESGPLRNVFALVALVAVAVLTVLLVRTIWQRAHLDDRLNDDALNDVMDDQYDMRYWDHADPGNDIMTTLVITVDGEIDSTTLASVDLVVLNRTAGTGTIVNIPLDTRVTHDGEKFTVASAFEVLTEEEFIVNLSWFTNIPADHIIVTTRDVLEDIASIKSFGPFNTVTSRLLASIRTDMRMKTLVAFGSELAELGLENLQVMEVPRWHEDPEEGDVDVPEGGWEIIHRTDLCYALGYFADAPAEEAAE